MKPPTPSKAKEVSRHIRDIPEATLMEFKWRRPRVYVMPEWVYRKGYRSTTVGGKGDE